MIRYRNVSIPKIAYNLIVNDKTEAHFITIYGHMNTEREIRADMQCYVGISDKQSPVNNSRRIIPYRNVLLHNTHNIGEQLIRIIK